MILEHQGSYETQAIATIAPAARLNNDLPCHQAETACWKSKKE